MTTERNELLRDRTAIVTGAGRGIGRGIAREMALAGAKVVIAELGTSLGGDGADDDLGAQVAAEIEAEGGRAIAVATDVTDPDSMAGCVAAAAEAFGPVDILVNNAGIVRANWIWDLAEEDFDAVVAVHLKAQFLGMQAVLPSMRERGYGRIINMTSRGALGQPLQAAYSAAKMGVIGLTYATSIELAGSGVTVNAVGPSALTRMASVASSMSDQELKDAPVPIAPIVAYLASEEADYINGQLFIATKGPTTMVSLYEGPVEVAVLKRDDDRQWELLELDREIRNAFGEHWATPGMLSRPDAEKFVAKMTGLLNLPNVWAEQ